MIDANTSNAASPVLTIVNTVTSFPDDPPSVGAPPLKKVVTPTCLWSIAKVPANAAAADMNMAGMEEVKKKKKKKGKKLSEKGKKKKKGFFSKVFGSK